LHQVSLFLVFALLTGMFVPYLKSVLGLVLLTFVSLDRRRLSSFFLHNKLRFREHFLPFLREDLFQLLATPKRLEDKISHIPSLEGNPFVNIINENDPPVKAAVDKSPPPRWGRCLEPGMGTDGDRGSSGGQAQIWVVIRDLVGRLTAPWVRIGTSLPCDSC